MKNFFGSMRTAAVLLAIYAAGLAAATFIESEYGTPAAQKAVYHNYVFMFLQLLLAANFVGVALRHRLWQQRKLGALAFHTGLMAVLAGALVTHLTGYEGIVHIRQGETSSAMVTAAGEVKPIPFEMTLDEFRLTRYPGSNSPSSYDSFLTVAHGGRSEKVRISTNRVFRGQGYRFFQSSYDPDELGTVLTANYDPVGMGVTYTGYLLLLIGMILMPFHPGSRVRVLARKLSSPGGKTAALSLALLLVSAAASAQPPGKYTVPKEIASQMGRLMVQSESGRIEPLDTYSNTILRKLHRSNEYEGLSPVQVVAGLVLNPRHWLEVPIIRQTNGALADSLGYRGGKYMGLYDLFDPVDGTYKPTRWVQAAHSKPAAGRSKFDKDIVKLDEKADITYMLGHGGMMPLFPLPGDPAGKWYSAGDDLSAFDGRDSMFVAGIMTWLAEETETALGTGDWKQVSEIVTMVYTYQNAKTTVELPSQRKVSFEIFYNRARIFFFSAMGYMTLGLVMLGFAVAAMFRRQRALRIALGSLQWLTGGLFLFNTAGIVIRWYVSGQPPWSNSYETMVYVGWATVLAGILFSRRSAVTMALTTFLGGIIMFVANLNWMDPQITPLVPVLKSPWLMAHVSVITASYGFFAMCFLLGTLSLCLYAFGNPSRIGPDVERLRTINEISAIIGLCLLTAGTFIGAVWANESWGRYWGWDPKETWALITMVVYAIITHSRFIPRLASDYAFSVMSVAGLGSVLMTYFGVNYYLQGMHSYGATDTPPAINVIFAVYAVLAAIAVVAGVRKSRAKR